MNQDEEFKQQIQANDAGEARAELLGVIKILQDENKSLRHVMSTWRKTTAQEMIEELEEKNRKLRLELHTLRYKESQEQRFIWWIWNVYGKHIQELLGMLEKTTFPFTPFGMSAEIRYIKDGTEHIYDGTYLDVEISADVKNTNPDYYNQPSNSDVSATQDVLIDVKTTHSTENEERDAR